MIDIACWIQEQMSWVIPKMEGMVGEETMCSLVGDNRATGLIVSRLYIGTKSNLVVAVQNAAVLLPPAYLVRIAGYRLSWANQSGGEIFHLKDGYGESVTVHEDDDLLYFEQEHLLEGCQGHVQCSSESNGHGLVVYMASPYR